MSEASGVKLGLRVFCALLGQGFVYSHHALGRDSLEDEACVETVSGVHILDLEESADSAEPMEVDKLACMLLNAGQAAELAAASL